MSSFVCFSTCLFIGIVSIGCNSSEETGKLNSEYYQSLGTVRVSSDTGTPVILKHKFELTNSTSSVLKLDNSRRSCACLQVKCPTVVKKNSAFEVELEFEARNLAEQRDEYVVFKTGNPDVPTITLGIKCLTVPYAMCEPKYSYDLHLNEKTDFTINGTYTIFVEKSVYENGPTATAQSEFLNIDLQTPAPLQVGKDLWAIRVPFKVSPAGNFSIAPGERKELRVQFDSLESYSRSIDITVSRKSIYDIEPKQAFFSTESTRPLKFEIKRISRNELKGINLNGKEVSQKHCTFESLKNGSLSVAIPTRIVNKVLDNGMVEKGVKQTLVFKLANGKVTIPVVLF